LKKAVIIEVGVIRILVVLLQLVFLKIYTSHTSIYELGIYYFLFTVSYSLNAFLLVPLDYFQQSQIYSLKTQGSSLKSFLFINTWLLKYATLILIAVLTLCYFIRPDFLNTITIITLMALSTYFVNLIRGFINNLERRRLAIYTLLIEGILKIGFYYAYSKYFESTAIVILFAIVSSSLLILCLLIYFVRKLDEYKLSKMQIYSPKEIIHFAYPISIGAVINWIQLQGYRMILVPLGLVEIVGIYGTVANVGTSGMSAFSTIYSQLFVPNLYKTHGKYLVTYLKYAILSIIGILGIGYFLREFIITLLTKHEFIKYSSLIIYGIISEAGNFLIGALTIYLTIRNLTKVTIKASISGLIAFVISFAILYSVKSINVYTIGLPIIFAQVIITMYLAIIIYKSKNSH
jgi:O-antigen/teichoic acid export membrane protein